MYVIKIAVKKTVCQWFSKFSFCYFTFCNSKKMQWIYVKLPTWC
jgi:hypothetical protein